MNKQTEDILIAFSLHERLNYPKVKKIFRKQTRKDQLIQLAEMQKVIAQKVDIEKVLVDSFKGNEPDLMGKGIRVDQNNLTESSRSNENEKDE